jgi:hypothetical protein
MEDVVEEIRDFALGPTWTALTGDADLQRLCGDWRALANLEVAATGTRLVQLWHGTDLVACAQLGAAGRARFHAWTRSAPLLLSATAPPRLNILWEGEPTPVTTTFEVTQDICPSWGREEEEAEEAEYETTELQDLPPLSRVADSMVYGLFTHVVAAAAGNRFRVSRAAWDQFAMALDPYPHARETVLLPDCCV